MPDVLSTTSGFLSTPEGDVMSRSTVERQWTAHGLNCAVLRVDLGHRCGYVRVPDEHPWHGIGYSEPAPGLPPSEEVMSANIVDEDIGFLSAFVYAVSDDEQRARYASTPEFRIAVHGSLTYAGELNGSDLPDGWWFGFDCAHADDSPTHWTEDRVAEETARMAEQLAGIAGVAHA